MCTSCEVISRKMLTLHFLRILMLEKHRETDNISIVNLLTAGAIMAKYNFTIIGLPKVRLKLATPGLQTQHSSH